MSAVIGLEATQLEFARGHNISCVLAGMTEPSPHKAFVGGVPMLAKATDLFELFQDFCGGSGVHAVHLIRSPIESDGQGTVIKTFHRGYGFVTFATAEAREKCMTERTFRMGSNELEVKPVDRSRRGKKTSCIHFNTTLFKLFVALKTLQVDSDNSNQQRVYLDKVALADYFRQFGEVVDVSVAEGEDGKQKPYGFISFLNESAPSNALKKSKIHQIVLNNQECNVECKRYTPKNRLSGRSYGSNGSSVSAYGSSVSDERSCSSNGSSSDPPPMLRAVGPPDQAWPMWPTYNPPALPPSPAHHSMTQPTMLMVPADHAYGSSVSDERSCSSNGYNPPALSASPMTPSMTQPTMPTVPMPLYTIMAQPPMLIFAQPPAHMWHPAQYSASNADISPIPVQYF